HPTQCWQQRTNVLREVTKRAERANRPKKRESSQSSLYANEGVDFARFREEGPNQMRSKPNPSHDRSNEQILSAMQQVPHEGGTDQETPSLGYSDRRQNEERAQTKRNRCVLRFFLRSARAN